MTRCKFMCVAVTKTVPWNKKNGFLFTAKFSPVTGGSPENDQFFELTPSGSVEIGTYKDDVFEVGKAYYLDFTLAVEGETK